MRQTLSEKVTIKGKGLRSDGKQSIIEELYYLKLYGIPLVCQEKTE